MPNLHNMLKFTPCFLDMLAILRKMWYDMTRTMDKKEGPEIKLPVFRFAVRSVRRNRKGRILSE